MNSGPTSSSEPDGGRDQLRVYFDADVLFAGAASPSDYSASQVLLTLSEITLIEGITTEPAVEEGRRNLEAKLPDATANFQRLTRRALTIREAPSRDALLSYVGRAEWKDLPHLVGALRAECQYLATYNVGDYKPGVSEVVAIQPGSLVRRVRDHLSAL